jgi:PBSX family phage terminase large subunit
MRYAPLIGKQLASVQRATAAGNLWEGAVRSSKTVCSLIRWLEFLIDGPRGELAMIGKTERTLKRNVIDPIVAMIGPRRAKLSAGSGEANILGRRIYLCGANDVGAVNKIAGMTLAGWYGDEIPRWPEDVFSMATTRTSITGAQWFGTGNPDAKNHWLNRDRIQRARYQIQRDGSVIERRGDDALDMNVFSFVIDDNPSLDPTFVARLKREYVGVFYKRNILGEWCMAEGAIFAEWDAERNVMPRRAMPEMRDYLAVGVDYGTSNPFHAGMLGIGPDVRVGSGEALYVTDEYRWDSRRQRRQLSDVEYSAGLRQWLREIKPTGVSGDLRGVAPVMVAVDPSAASFRVQCYRDGLPTRAADNEVSDSLRVAGSLIATGKIIVAEECPALIDEIPGYVWDERAARLGEEKPLKIDDHGIDGCLRYAPYSSRHIWHHDIFETPLLV